MEGMTEEQGGADRSQMMLVVLIVLAFIASVVMLFTDSDGALKLALLASLWAAIIGFFLVFRYRREAESARRELTHHGELHDVEVARAAAEREALAESRALELRDKQHSRDTEVLQEIQRELAGIRAQLETLAGREFEYEPAALRAGDAVVVTSSPGPSPSLSCWRAPVPARTGRTSACPAYAGGRLR